MEDKFSIFPSPEASGRDFILQDFLSPSPGRTDPPVSGQARAPPPAPTSFLSPFEAMAGDGTSCSIGSFLEPCFMKKRGFEEGGDSRFKRMMNNRASAERSRSRRLAYIVELEKKKSQLTEENAQLRRVLQEHELFLAASAAAANRAEPPRKCNLCRSLSSLF